MNIESISSVLQQVRLPSYLDTRSVIAVSRASSTLFELVSCLINFRFFFPQSRDNKLPIKYQPKRLSSVIPNMITQSLEAWVLSFPPTITHLRIRIKEEGYSNCRFFHKLPQSLKALSIINWVLCEALYFEELPIGLRRLTIDTGCIDNNALDCLPPNLTHFNISTDSCIKLPNNLPSSLTHLHLYIPYQDSNYDYIPPKVTHLFLSEAESVDHLPPSITHLLLMYCVCTYQYLPSSITQLAIWGLRGDLDYLPQSLKYLHVQVSKARFNVDYLPPSITHLELEYLFNEAIDNLPPNLTHLTLGEAFSRYVDHLPSTLKVLKFGRMFNKHIDNLPPSLKHLTLGGHFSKPIDHLPLSLTSLVVGEAFTSPLDHLPKSLQRLDLSRSHYYKTKPAIVLEYWQT